MSKEMGYYWDKKDVDEVLTKVECHWVKVCRI